MRLSGSHIIMESLLREGIDTVFGYPGGAVLPMYHVMPEYPQIRHILVRHEQASAHMADGYARVRGNVGVCIGTSGPGATNLVTGLATAQMDSIPMIAITGQVARPFIGKDAFQECDITGVTLPIVKHNYLVRTAADLAPTFAEAFHIARTGRPGVVHIDIPKDVQLELAEFDYPSHVELPWFEPKMAGDPAEIKRAAKLINEAKRPVIIAGHGVILSEAYAELRELAEKAQIPVVNTLLGISSFPGTHPLFLGMMGMHGMAWVNYGMGEADVIIGIGQRWDDRALGRFVDFAPQAKLIHIDIDPSETDKNVKITAPITGDARTVLRDLLPQIQNTTHADWLARIDTLKREHPSVEIPSTERLLPQHVSRALYEVTNGEAYVATGVGQHQMWQAQFFWYDHPNRLITSGGLGTMGFALPAAMGAKMAKPEATVWAVEGDGGFQMNLQELATCVQENIPVKIAVVDNGYLGMVRQWQELFHDNRYSAVRMVGPDYVKLAEAYGIPAFRTDRVDNVEDLMREAMAVDGPALIHFVVEAEENCYPMVPPGASLAETIKDPRHDRILAGV
ncbi:MAG: biosynthetic-type acetolactate synthase large subunit [Dehalococcoidia bacterium]